MKRRPKPDTANMNPLNEWYQTKPDLRAFLSNYERENFSLLDRWPETQANARLMAASGITDRLMALTLMAAVKRYFPPEP